LKTLFVGALGFDGLLGSTHNQGLKAFSRKAEKAGTPQEQAFAMVFAAAALEA